MGRAYTEKEREEIRKKLMEAGLDMFHDNNVKDLSIAGLTKAAGISQGGFYSFFSDKEELIAGIIQYRLNQKLDLIRENFDASLEDPMRYLASLIYENTMDMKRKADRKQMYRNLKNYVMKSSDTQRAMTESCRILIADLQNYLNDHGRRVTIDIDGILEVIGAQSLLSYHSELMDSRYFQEILKMLIDNGVKQYMKEGSYEQ